LSSRLKLDDDASVSEIEALSSDNLSPASAYMGLGILDDVKAQHEVAQAFYKHALKIEPKSSKALMNMGYSHYMSGNYTDATRFTLAALEQEPDNEKAFRANQMKRSPIYSKRSTKSLLTTKLPMKI